MMPSKAAPIAHWIAVEAEHTGAEPLRSGEIADGRPVDPDADLRARACARLTYSIAYPRLRVQGDDDE